MRKVFMLASALFLVSALAISMAAPALACIPGTALTITASDYQIDLGECVDLTIVEDNTGSNEHAADLTDVKVYLEPFGVYLTSTSNVMGEVFSGDTDGDDELDYDETWQWVVNVCPTATTTYTATGEGVYDGTTLITYPTYPERGSVTVEVTENGGGEGLTPGFWKNHTDEAVWGPTGYSPSDDFDAIFGTDMEISLLEALQLKGGKCKALARHAVAALLNAAHPDVSYEFTVAEVIDMVQNATDCEYVKDDLEEQNELGGGIDAHGDPL